MNREQAIQVLLNSQLLSIWEKDRCISDPAGLREIGNALQIIEPSYHIDWTCNECLINMMNRANQVRKENTPVKYTFPKQ